MRFSLDRSWRAAAALALLAAAAAAGPPPRPAEVDALRQAIWASFATVEREQAAHSAAKASGTALAQLQLQARAPAVQSLWQLAQAGANDDSARTALGLVFQWGDPALAGRALGRLVDGWRDNAALAPLLEAGYADSLASAKRDVVATLAAHSRSRAVAGSAQYLLALETLAAAGVSPGAKAAALAQVRGVRDRFADVPTTLLGGGTPPRLGRVAAALLFKVEQLHVGVPLPPMTAHDLADRVVGSAQFAHHPVVIAFWATWCPPCVASLPQLRDIAAVYAPQGVEVVSISADAAPETVRAFAARQPMPWTQWIVGPSGTVSAQWSNTDYPLYLLVDRHGRIAAIGPHLDAVRARLAAVAAN